MLAAGRPNDKLSDRIRVRARNVSPAIARVLEFIDNNRHEVMTRSALEIAATLRTSDATVVRAVQALGFSGLRELRRVVATASGVGQTPADTIARTVASIKARSATAVEQVFADHQETFNNLSAPETQASILAAVAQLRPAKRIGVFGIGATAFLARYFAMSLNRIGYPTFVFDGCLSPLPEQLLEMRNVDALVMLAYGKPFREAISTLGEARRLKAPVVLITDSKEVALTRHATAVVPVLRGFAGRIALHGATFVCLEAINFAMAAENPPKAISTLERLTRLRSAVHK
jgi:DNA-binding MurR/RpiR family transcriptional regulator